MASVDSDASEAERRTELIEAFNLFDKNGSGKLTAEDLTSVMRTLGYDPTQDEIADILKDVAAHDGQVSSDAVGNVESVTRDQFVNYMMVKAPVAETVEDEIRRAFRLFDNDGNGYISAQELKAVLQRLGEAMTEEQIKEMIAEADVDGDGQVSFEEFRRVMTLGPMAANAGCRNKNDSKSVSGASGSSARAGPSR